MGRKRQTFGPAGEVRVVLRDLRHGERDRERGQREVDAVEAQRGQTDHEADAEPDERRDGQCGEIVPAVIVTEDRRRVAAEGHEGSLTDRDLPRVSRHDVLPENRDEEDGHGRARRQVVVGERERQQRDRRRDDQSARDTEQRSRVASHTLRTRVRPKSPDGLTSSTTSINTNAAGSRSCGVTQLT